MTEPLLTTRDLGRRFGGLAALDAVTLTIEEGEIRALIGPNGAGKTTLINLLSGLLPPTDGAIVWRGDVITPWSAARRARAGIARTMQVTSLFPSLTVYENVWLGAQRQFGRLPALTDRRRFTAVGDWTRECLAIVGLSARSDERAGAIGHGDQRLLEIAIGLSLRPRLLLLDEPTAGMSVKESADIVRRLREIHERDRIAMLIVEHDMRVVMELAERISVLHLGRVIAEGAPSAVAADLEVQRVYLGRAEC